MPGDGVMHGLIGGPWPVVVNGGTCALTGWRHGRVVAGVGVWLADVDRFGQAIEAVGIAEIEGIAGPAGLRGHVIGAAVGVSLSDGSRTGAAYLYFLAGD